MTSSFAYRPNRSHAAETPPPTTIISGLKISTILAIGEELEPRLALQVEGAQDRAILRGAELGLGQAPRGEGGARLQQLRRTQETTDVLGAH